MCQVIPSFRVKPVRNIVTIWDETLIKCSYKQACILLRYGLLRLLNFSKQFDTNRNITESRGKTLGRKNIQPSLFHFFSIEKRQTLSTSQSLSDTFVLVFYAQYLTLWKQWLKVILSRRAGIKLIWPISSNRAPRPSSPALRLPTNENLHFLSKLLVYSAGAAPSVFYVILRDQNDYQIFPTVSQNTLQYKLALISQSKYTETLINKHLGIQRI